MPVSRNKVLGFRKSHAIIIGIDEYPKLNANLRTAVRDSVEIAMRLKVLQGFDHVLLMNNVGKAQIEALLNWLQDENRPARLVIPEQLPADGDSRGSSSRIAWLKTQAELSGEEQTRELDYEVLNWQPDRDSPQREKLYLAPENELDIRPEDSILFYYAGHGFPGEFKAGPAGYLAPADAQNKQTDNDSLLPMEEVYRALCALNCKHTLLILDCCFAGKFRFASLNRAGRKPFLQPLYKRRYERYKSSEAWQVLASAGPDQLANDSAKWARIRDHSPFAKTLMDALEGKADARTMSNRTRGDGIITAHELYLYVWDQVESITARQDVQHPGLFPMEQHREGEFIFINPNVKEDAFKFAKDPDRNPYKSLLTYEPEDANLFFGRDKAIAGLQRMLPLQSPAAATETPQAPFVLFITAPSAAGKSSLVRAGLFPALHNQYGYEELLIFRPGSQIQGQSIVPVEGNRPDEYRRESWEGWYQLEARLEDPGKKQMILVDQYEEFFTDLADAAEQRDFEQRLLDLIEAENHRRLQPLIVVFTLRSDVEWQMPETLLGGQRGADAPNYWTPDHIFRLQPMTLDELREALTGPAWWAMHDFKNTLAGTHTDDGEELVNQILKDVMYYPAALPLLSCVMHTFYERSRENNRSQKLVKEDYDGFQGVAGALSEHAEKFYEGLGGEDREMMKKVFLRMVDPGDAGYTRRKVTYSEPSVFLAMMPPGNASTFFELDYAAGEKDKELKALIDGMEAAHLIVQGKNKEGQPVIEPAHDALITYWPRCRKWIREFGKDQLILQRQLWQAVLDSIRPEMDRAPGYAARAADGFDVDPDLSVNFSQLWDTSHKLLQVLHHIAAAANSALMALSVEDIMDTFSGISDEERDTFRKFWYGCQSKNKIPDLNSLALTGYSDALLELMLQRGEHWLNQAELNFVRQSWTKRIEDIMDLKRQRDDAVAARELAEKRQREVLAMAERISLQTNAFKKKYQEETRKDLLVIQAGFKPDLHLVLVGIDKYQQVPPLRGPVNDTRAVAESFQAQEGKLYRKVHLHLLNDEAATRANILQSVETVREQAGVFDFVFLFFAGHGQFMEKSDDLDLDELDGTFIPYDFNPKADRGATNTLMGAELCSELMKIQSKVVFFADFVSGAEFLSTLVRANRSEDLEQLTHNVFGLSGAGPGEMPFEIVTDGEMRGVFSYALTDALSNPEADLEGNGVLYLDELLQYTTRLILERKTGKPQNVFAIVPSTVSNIPLVQYGEHFALPTQEMALSGHIGEDRVIESILTRYAADLGPELNQQFGADYDQMIDYLSSMVEQKS